MIRPLSAALAIQLGILEWFVGTALASIATSTWCQQAQVRGNFPPIERFALSHTASIGEALGLLSFVVSIGFAVGILRSRGGVFVWLLGAVILFVCVAMWSAVVLYGAWLPYKWC